MLQPRSRRMVWEVLSVLVLLSAVHPAHAIECFSPSYSVQKGRTAMSDIEARDFMGNEYQDLKEFFQSLDGEWAGNGKLDSCEGLEDQVQVEIENYAINSEAKTGYDGQFVLESTLYCQEKRTKQYETFRLFLSQDRLATKPNIPVSDIELVSASPNALTFVTKNRGRGYLGPLANQEVVITIRKTASTSLMFEKAVYVHGRLTGMSTWQLDRK